MNKLYDFLSINLGNKVTLKYLKACAYSWRQDGEDPKTVIEICVVTG